jgi:signal transduction histidine kinase/CheY-like chemotaxis protein/HPt (histidine-containing phosphotransfer) domain-containing protein
MFHGLARFRSRLGKRLRAITTRAMPGPTKRSARLRYLSVSLAATIGAAVSIQAFVAVSHWDTQLRDADIRQLVHNRNQIIASSLADADELLQIFADYIATLDHPLGRSEFLTFSNRLRMRRPEILSMGWAPRVPRSERAALERMMRETTRPNFEIWEGDLKGNRHPAGERDEYTPIIYRNPADLDDKIVGFDSSSTKERADAIERTRATGKSAATAPVQLISVDRSGIGVQLFDAVYLASTGPHADAPQPPIGYAYVTISIVQVFDKILAKILPEGFDFYVYDPNATEDKRLLYWRASPTRPDPIAFPGETALLGRPHWSGDFEIAGRRFAAIYAPTHDTLNVHASWQAPATLAVGLAITAMLILYLLLSLRRTAHLEALATQLQTVNQRFNTALENMPQGLSMFDGDQRLIVCNSTYARLYRLPPEYTQAGTPFRTVLEACPFSSKPLDGSTIDVERLRPNPGREALTVEANLTDGRTLSVTAKPMPGGGWIAVHQDVTERKHFEKKLAAASQAKSQFLATMSHEIRTPMNAVLGLTSSLLESHLDSDQRKTAETIYDAGNGLLGILNDILDFSQLESGQLSFESVVFSTKQLLDGVVSMFAPRAAAKGINLREHSDANVPAALRGDVGRIRQVLLNLLSNATKFTERGEVTIGARCLGLGTTEATVEWLVTDTGIGIAPERIGELFKDFRQADASISRRYGGSGLGLAICKRLIEQMGGKIDAVSSPGEGSTFSFILTLPIGAAVEDEEEVPGHDVLTDLLAGLDRPLRILVVDDKATNRLVVSKMLKALSVVIDEAHDGAQALATASRVAPDVILMDVSMPGMSGLDATRAIRALDGPLARVPIIAFTANAFTEDIKQCLAAGMNDFLSKPVHKQELMGAIARAIQASAHGAQTAEVIAAGLAKTAPAAGETVPLVDRKVLDDFAALVGEASTDDVIHTFMQDAETRLKTLRELSCESNREFIKTEAHSLKGEAATLGLLALSQLARTLEHSAHDIDADQYSALTARLDSTFELSRRELTTARAA